MGKSQDPQRGFCWKQRDLNITPLGLKTTSYLWTHPEIFDWSRRIQSVNLFPPFSFNLTLLPGKSITLNIYYHTLQSWLPTATTWRVLWNPGTPVTTSGFLLCCVCRGPGHWDLQSSWGDSSMWSGLKITTAERKNKFPDWNWEEF